MLAREDIDTEELLATGYRAGKPAPTTGTPAISPDLPASELASLVQELTEQMHAAAGELQFELAARLRDEVADVKKELRKAESATACTELTSKPEPRSHPNLNVARTSGRENPNSVHLPELEGSIP